MDADIVVAAAGLPRLSSRLNGAATLAGALRIQFTTDERYQGFIARAVEAEVLGIRVRVACLEDVTLGKLWAYVSVRGNHVRLTGVSGRRPTGSVATPRADSVGER